MLQQIYPINTAQHKPIERHCFIEFYEGSEPVKTFLVEDQSTLDSILNIGYDRKDMQNLSMTDYYNYLTTDGLRCGGDNEFIQKYEKALAVTKEIFAINKEEFPNGFDQLYFSFPEELIERKIR